MNSLRWLAIAVVVSGIGFAQDLDQWSAVQALHKGDRVGVIQTNQKRVEGHFESATATSITLEADQQVTLSQAEVVRVYRPARHGRVFGAVVGGAIGVAAGAVVDGTVGHYLRNERGDPARGVITAIGGGVGAGLGAVATGGYRTIYRRAK